MSNYFVDGNPWGGSFIREASTDGNTWEPMVAKSSSSGKFLGRQGLSTGGGGNLDSGYNSVAFSDTTFSIYKPVSGYNQPDTVSNLVYSGTLKQSFPTTCTVTLSRNPLSSGTWDKFSNIKEDFSVNCVISSASSPYFTAGTKFDCVVTVYDSNTGILTFIATPSISGTCKFGIIVRNGQGTGMFSNAFETSTFEVEYDEFYGVRSFASSRTSSWGYTGSDFLSRFYANMPTTLTFRQYTISSTGNNIPSWQSTLGTNPTSYNVTINPDSTNVNSPGWGNGSNTHMTPAQTSRRLWWQFSEAKVVKSFVLIMGSIWESKYVNFEIVASNDGANFVRLPTIWQTGIEDTFNLYHSRRDKNGNYLWRLMYDGTSYPNLKTQATPLARVANVYSIYMKGTAANMAIISISNATAYTYYGIGSVGTECPYSSSSRSDTSTRTFARQPCGSYVFVGSVTPTDWDGGGVIAAMSDRADIAGTNQWAWNYLNVHNLALPQISSDTSLTAPTVYKHWRIRASSAFLGTCGSTTKAHFWKLGLYRNATLAAADTYGLSSNNYLQQYANVLGISTNGTTPTTQPAGGTKRDSMFVSKGDWTQQWGNATQFASVNGTAALYNNAVDVTFGAELACIQFTLDVAGEIGAIRFPDNMYYDANVRGGTFIIEAATASAPTTWVTMVATSTTSAGKYLGREGILNAVPSAGVIAAGNQALDPNFKLFTVAPSAAGSYVVPQTLATLSGSFTHNSKTTGAIITIQSGLGLWTADTNEQFDFSVHMIQKGATQWTPGTTKFNGNVMAYNKVTGELQFNVIPPVSGTCTLVVFVRDGKTGLLATTLLSADVSVSPSLFPTSTLMLDGSLYSESGDWLDLSGNGRHAVLGIRPPIYNSQNSGYFIFGSARYAEGNTSSAVATSAHTLVAWFYQKSFTSWDGIISHNVGIGSGSVLGFSDSTTLGVHNVAVNGNLAASINIGNVQNMWIFASVSFAANGTIAYNVYKQGTLLKSTGSLYFTLASNGKYVVGSTQGAGSYSFDGNIAFAAIYPSVLSETEVTSIYNLTKSRFGF